MTNENLPDREIDDRLRRGFSDDLPPQVEAIFEAEFRTFRRRIDEPARSTLKTSWPAWRMAAALASLVLAILGATLHSGRTATAFADSIELWQQQARLIRNLGRVEEMEARIERRGSIRWRHGVVSLEPPQSRFLEELAPELEPRTLARRLEGAWRRKTTGVYQASPPDGSAGIEITVDPGSGLPIRLSLERREYSVQLRWVLRPVGSVLASRSETPSRR